MIFNNYKDVEKYFKNTYTNLRFEVSGYILSVKDIDFNLISNYDLRFTNFLMLDININRLSLKRYKNMKLNYKF